MTKYQWFLIIIVTLLAIIVISSVFLIERREPRQSPEPIIVFSPSPTPIPPTAKELYVIATPTTEDLNNLSVIAPITVTFSTPINISTLEYRLDPPTETFIIVDQTETSFTIKPSKYWRPDTVYNLKITSIRGQDGSILRRPIEIKIKAVINYDEVNKAEPERYNPL